MVSFVLVLDLGLTSLRHASSEQVLDMVELGLPSVGIVHHHLLRMVAVPEVGLIGPFEATGQELLPLSIDLSNFTGTLIGDAEVYRLRHWHILVDVVVIVGVPLQGDTRLVSQGDHLTERTGSVSGVGGLVGQCLPHQARLLVDF